ncbi:MAG: N-acetylmuramoyl-L-alanine amidase [Actinomycetota bacterium]|nr:N-acetylmuramoyl-L-alanine amidase [Actinomycetota bacterium]
MAWARLHVFAAALAATFFLVPAADAAVGARPPVVWLKGEGNFSKAHRSTESLDKIVVHVTEGAFWGSVQWLKSPRAHASSHYVVSRRGKIVQLVHLSDIAWHAGNWSVNTQSVGIEHEGFTYGPSGFTNAQYHASARLAGWIARRALMPIDRKHFIGHADVPAPGGGRGGASHHTDPGPRWKWNYYLGLVRRYAGAQKLSVLPVVSSDPLRGVVPWGARATGDIKRVEFSVNGRVVATDAKAPFTLTGGLNTTRLTNGRHVLQVHGIAGPGRYDVARRTVVVDNKAFALTSAGARPWTKVRGTVRLRVRPWGAKASSMTLTVNGVRRAVDRRTPFLFTWNARRAKPGKHVLEVTAASVDGRVAKQRIPLVVAKAVAPKKPKPVVPVVPTVRIQSQTVSDGQEVTGLVLWRVVVAGKVTRVEFLVDGVLRGADVAAPYTFGWDSSADAPGPHRLTARAVGKKTVEQTVTVTAPAPPENAGSATP